ncbi:MAG: hypothetical protein HKN03_14800 [Acidimicrobiales bacterium]|nr:hypothetical protein [Acidimicrobiales bacterium]
MRVRLAVVLLIMVGGFSSPAAAQDGVQVCFGDGSASYNRVIGSLVCATPGNGGDADGGVGDGSYCRYWNAVMDDLTEPIVRYESRFYEVPDRADYPADQGLVNAILNTINQDENRYFSGTGRWYNKQCFGPAPENVNLGSFGPFPELGPLSFPEVVNLALAQAELLVSDPPEVLHTGKPSLLQLPTFFWVENTYWTTAQQATAVYGRLEVVVTAEPSGFALTVGGDILRRCNENLEWAFDVADDDPRACTYTFEDAPDSGRSFPLVLTVQHATAWYSNAPGWTTPQPLDSIEVASGTSDHQVAELLGLRNG